MRPESKPREKTSLRPRSKNAAPLMHWGVAPFGCYNHDRMGWRRPGMIIAAVLACSALSALVAYRLGARRTLPAATVAASSASIDKQPCVQFSEAGPLVGNTSCVTGRVLKVFTSKSGNTYLDFCEDYRTCPFSSVIFSQDMAKFGDLPALQGQFVEIRGLVSYYKGRPQIVIRSPEQLKLRE